MLGRLALIRGADAQGNVQETVTAIDTTKNQVKVQTPAGQTIVLAIAPTTLQSLQIGAPFTFTALHATCGPLCVWAVRVGGPAASPLHARVPIGDVLALR
jgi:hypothetical protein